LLKGNVNQSFFATLNTAPFARRRLFQIRKIFDVEPAEISEYHCLLRRDFFHKAGDNFLFLAFCY